MTPVQQQKAAKAFAERWEGKGYEKGESQTYEEVLEDIKQRDYNDTHRETAPLKPAEGCVMVDTTELDFEQSVEKIISVIKERI